MAQVKAGSFTSRSTTGIDTVTLGWQPKAVVVFVAKAAFSSTDMVDGNIQQAVVISDGSATRSEAIFEADAADTTDNQHGFYDSVSVMDGAGTVVVDGALSFVSTGFEINWSTISASWSIGYLALGGSDISAKVLDFSKSSTGSLGVTGAGFQPKSLFAIGGLVAGAPDTTGAGGRLTLGASDLDGDEHGVGTNSANAAGTTDTSRVLATTALLAQRASSNASAVLGVSVTSYDSDGFTLNFTTLTAGTWHFAALALGGAGVLDSDLVNLTADTTTGAHTQTMSSLPFQPSAGVVFGMSHNATNTNATQAALTLGFFDRDLNQASVAYASRDASAVAVTYEGASATGALIAFDGSAGTGVTPYLAHGDLSAIGATSIDVDWGSGKNATDWIWSALLLNLDIGNATVSPAAISVPATLPTPTLVAHGTAAPGVIALAASLPAVTAVDESGNAQRSPDVIARSFTLPAVVATGGTGASASPVTLARAFTLPSVGIAVNPAPPPIAVAFTLPTPTVDVEYQTGFGDNPTTNYPATAPNGNSFLPETAVQLVDANGTHVRWLPWALGGYGWREELDGTMLTGSGTVSLLRSDPALADVTFQHRLRFWYRGKHVWTSRIEPRRDRTRDQREDAGQVAEIGGRGTLADLDDLTVDPYDFDATPPQQTYRYNFAHPDFFESAAWVPAEDVTGATPGVNGPIIPKADDRTTKWPDAPAAIWGPSGSPTTAPDGTCYFRRTFTIGGDQPIRRVDIDFAINNSGTVYYDGQVIAELHDDWNGSNWREIHHIDNLKLTPGVHTIAVKAHNITGNTEDIDDPGSVRLRMHLVTLDGEIGDTVVETDTTWQVLEYPASEPGWTWGGAIRHQLAAQEEAGADPIDTAFNRTHDSGNELFDIKPEIAVPVGSTVLQMVQQAAEADLDVRYHPRVRRLYAWNKGGRGSVTSIDLPDGDAADACIIGLSHDTEPPIATRVTGEWANRTLLREDSAAITAYGYRSKHVKLPQVRTEGQARKILDALLDLFGRERVQFTADIHPRIEEQIPWISYGVGDWVNVPNRDGDLESVRVRSITSAVDENGLVRHSIVAGDVIYEQEEQLQAWLARRAPGSLGGRTHQSMPQLDTRQPAVSKVRAGHNIFHLQGAVAVSASEGQPPEFSGRLSEAVVTLTTAGTSTTTVAVRVNGSSVGSVNLGSGVTRAVLDLAVDVDPATDLISVEITAAGSGAAGLVVTAKTV